MKNRLTNIAAAATLFLLGGTSLASANVITTGGGTTAIVGGYDLVANSTSPYSYVNVSLSSPITFGAVNSLTATFTDLLGGSAAGSPSIELDVTGAPSGYFRVYIGAPVFNNTVAGLNALSGAELDNADGNTGSGPGAPYNPLSSWQGLYGADTLTDVAFLLEDNSGLDQHLTLTGLSLNGVNLLAATTPVPEPLTLSLFSAGLAGAAALRRRKKQAG